MKLGITPYYISKYGMHDGAKRMLLHGYKCLDFQKFEKTDTEFFMLSEHEFEKQIIRERNMYEAEGIEIYQAHGPWRYPPQDGTELLRQERFDAMSKAIRGCAYLGAKTMVIHPIMPLGANCLEDSDEVKRINLEFMSSLCEVAKEYGIVISFENMPFRLFPINSVCEITDFAKKVNSANFKVCLDTGHAIVCGESLAEAVRYIGKDMLYSLHIHDNYGKRDEHNPPPNGVGDWSMFKTALNEIGFDGVFSFETDISCLKDLREEDIDAKEIALADWGKQMIFG